MFKSAYPNPLAFGIEYIAKFRRIVRSAIASLYILINDWFYYVDREKLAVRFHSYANERVQIRALWTSWRSDDSEREW